MRRKGYEGKLGGKVRRKSEEEGKAIYFRDDIEETFRVLDKDGDGILGREGIILGIPSIGVIVRYIEQ